MRNIFLIYWLWFVATIVFMNYATDISPMLAKTAVCLSVLNFSFVCLAPVYILIHSDVVKSNRSDSKYLNYCLYAGLIRSFIWSVSILGIRDHLIILALNAFGMAVIALTEGKFKRISNEYFKF